MGTPVDRTETFAAAGSRTVALPGRFIRVLSAPTQGVTITTRPGVALTRYAGQGIDVGPGGFKSFDIALPVAGAVTFTVSDTEQADNQTAVNATVSATISPAATLAQPGDVSCAAGAITELYAGGAATLTVLVRSSDTNTYAEGTVRIGTAGVGAASGIELNPGDSIALDTTAAVYAWNAGGVAIDLQVLVLGS